MRFSVALRLARASLLPTVWTNVLAGVALAGGSWAAPRLVVLVVALSLFYAGGMFLNDAFDREFDAKAHPERPIPAGEVSVGQVFRMGFFMLGVGLGLLIIVGQAFPGLKTWEGALSGLVLAGLIVLYDAYHKGNPWSPLLMGLCRMLVYVTAALAVTGRFGAEVFLGASVLLCYIIGITFVAKSENINRVEHAWPLGFLAVPVIYGAVLAFEQPVVLLPLVLFTGWIVFSMCLLMRRGSGALPLTVVRLLAGISILDAMILAGHAQFVLMTCALLAFILTLHLPRGVGGT